MRDKAGQILPYTYEPEVESDNDEHEIAGVDYDDEGRLNNISWCSCGEYQIMPAVRESLCCKEINQVGQKMDNIEADLNCITEHPGFYSVCLDQWVLETVYFQYRQQYGQGRHNATENQ
ncbi:uncharacterized protein LOC110990883 [Acanthaster planci]|uniref:Uncharacterized protein LOC110990883 n=1 Tax=Acanthaster planci TaxID=133434 RepID=A0A8B8A2R2_ACAPL|nr:uncharacterized protein LOC110990883 [Acanthaster planci]